MNTAITEEKKAEIKPIRNIISWKIRKKLQEYHEQTAPLK